MQVSDDWSCSPGTRPRPRPGPRPRLKPLDRQVIVITGATSGIGLVTARKAASAGARVFLIARNEDALQRICSGILEAGGQAAYAAADVGDEVQLSAACTQAIELFGGLDTWVNVAGVAIYASLRATPRDEHEQLFRTNYWGVVNGCLVAASALEERGGALITVGSVVSDLGTPILGAYAASKHAVKGYVDSLRIEFLADRTPISVSLILPGGVATPLAEHAANHLGHAAKVPPPAYAPEDVAAAILHCATQPRREMVIGGVAALQRLGHALVPHLVDRVSTWIIPLLGDRRRPAPRCNNLQFPRGGGERSVWERFVLRSAYTTASRFRWSFAVAAVAAGAFVFATRGRRPRRP